VEAEFEVDRMLERLIAVYAGVLEGARPKHCA
jgi:hypothetical protein